MTLSRSSSASSVRSARGGSKGKQATYICRHQVSGGTRFNDVMGALPIQFKKKKCFDCQCATSDGVLTLLDAIRSSPDMRAADGTALRRFAETLFEKLAGQRRSTFKDDWNGVLLGFAAVCYLHVPVGELRQACESIKSRYGSGVDRLLLQGLARAVCVEEGVWDFFEPRDAPMFATVNHVVQQFRDQLTQVDRFSRVKDMFAAARELGKVCDDTVAVFSKVSLRFDRWNTGSR
jgi:hypothetical protein